MANTEKTSNIEKMSLLREGDTDNVSLIKDEDTEKVSLFDGEVVLVKENEEDEKESE